MNKIKEQLRNKNFYPPETAEDFADIHEYSKNNKHISDVLTKDLQGYIVTGYYSSDKNIQIKGKIVDVVFHMSNRALTVDVIDVRNDENNEVGKNMEWFEMNRVMKVHSDEF